MKKFNQDRRGGGGFGGGRFNRDNRDSRGPVTMHNVICSDCRKNCQVPFRPSGDKPVYCKDCFSRRGAGGSREKEREGFSTNDIKTQLAMINIKLDRLLKKEENKDEPADKIEVAKEIVEEVPVAIKPKKVIKSKKVSKKK